MRLSGGPISRNPGSGATITPAMRIRFLAIALLTSFSARRSLACGQTRGGPAPRPNIVWISNEDMSPHLGVYGDASRGPDARSLRAQSIRFTHAFSTAPVCAPSRAAIITGMYQAAIGAQHMRTTEDRVPELPGPYLAVPPFYVKAFPEYLRAAGYYTSNRAKTDYQFGVPFTIWDDLGAGRTGGTAPIPHSRSSPCSTSRSRTRARASRAARRARGNRS